MDTTWKIEIIKEKLNYIEKFGTYKDVPNNCTNVKHFIERTLNDIKVSDVWVDDSFNQVNKIYESIKKQQ